MLGVPGIKLRRTDTTLDLSSWEPRSDKEHLRFAIQFARPTCHAFGKLLLRQTHRQRVSLHVLPPGRCPFQGGNGAKKRSSTDTRRLFKNGASAVWCSESFVVRTASEKFPFKHKKWLLIGVNLHGSVLISTSLSASAVFGYYIKAGIAREGGG